MLKPTKRKAFNFLRSYFDVLNELDNDKDKLNFLLSIINKQFLDEDPKDLNFIVNLCYESQRHSIESSVKGWKRVNKIDPTTNPMTNPVTDPTTNPSTNPKEEEEEEEVKEEEEEKVKNNHIDEIYLLYPSKCVVKNSSTSKTLKDKEKIKSLIKSVGYEKLKQTIIRYVSECKKDQVFMKNFKTFLNNLPDYESESLDIPEKKVIKSLSTKPYVR